MPSCSRGLRHPHNNITDSNTMLRSRVPERAMERTCLRALAWQQPLPLLGRSTHRLRLATAEQVNVESFCSLRACHARTSMRQQRSCLFRNCEVLRAAAPRRTMQRQGIMHKEYSSPTFVQCTCNDQAQHCQSSSSGEAVSRLAPRILVRRLDCPHHARAVAQRH
jgi:hypothetical protein